MYKDRGIIKWAPFDALVGFNEMVSNYIKSKNKIERPVLLEDKLNELDYILKEAFQFKLEVEVKYFEKGFIKKTVGIINKIGILNKKITISNHLSLNVENILNIKK